LIVVQTPLRISFFGGGTDFPSFFMEEGGCVLTSAIDKYIFVVVKERFDDKLRVGYTQTEMVDRIDQIQHELIRESLRTTGIHSAIEVTTMGDIPSEGSGLGSSSTVTVGALHALYAYRGEIVSAEKLAREACSIEIDKLPKADRGAGSIYCCLWQPALFRFSTRWTGEGRESATGNGIPPGIQ
jgi:D-glycero-alpha-D-manno-heptose-7-phosphate kinase